MNRFLCVLILCAVSTGAFPACSNTPTPVTETVGSSPTPAAAPKITSESVVEVAVQRAEIPAGGLADTVIGITVQSGYHINSNPPTFPYLKATELEMPNKDDISLNSVGYPKPLVRKFAFSDKPLHVYEGETQLTVSLKAAKSAMKGQRSIPAKLRIQACDDQVCYPPGSIDVLIPVLIK